MLGDRPVAAWRLMAWRGVAWRGIARCGPDTALPTPIDEEIRWKLESKPSKQSS